MEILIAEDDFISRNLLKKMLVEMGHGVIEAEDGRQALDLFKQKRSRIVITDWMMPQMDGLQLCHAVRQLETAQYTYVIMLTAKDNKEDLIQVFEAGADDYIAKPFDPAELKARIKTSIRIVDLQEQHQGLQQTLIESRNKLRVVFDAMQEQIVSIDRQFQIVSANSSFMARHANNYDGIIGQNCFTPFGNENRPLCSPDIKPYVEKVFSEGRPQKYLQVSTADNGLKTYFQVACVPITNESDDRVRQIAIVTQDITEDRRKAEKIEQLNKRLIESSSQIEAKNKTLEATLKRLEDTQAQMLQSEKMASIGQLAAGVAHEINNPTGFVSSNLKTLSDYQNDIAGLIESYQALISDLASIPDNQAVLTKAVRDRIESIKSVETEIDIEFLQEDISDLIQDCREGTERIKKIVLDLKDFAHPGEDKIQSTDINNGLASTLNVVNNEIKYKATVVKEFGDIPTVKGYPQQLNQVFMNILVNAAQAIEKQGEITIRTRSVDSQVEVTISDTGSGIAEENLTKIFDPFFTTKDVGKGTGLGMNIAYNIIQKHNGTIDVQSTVGQGTTFTIRIPAEASGG